jgi:hypothetical protein
LKKLCNEYKGIHSKGGVKKADKVHQRIGGLKSDIPLCSNIIIDVSADEKTKVVSEITYKKNETKHADKSQD